MKPISIPDRWDDFSVLNALNWSGNGVWDQEKFTDTNGNHLYDPGEPFVDGSSEWTKGGAGPLNGRYDQEYYEPLNTGYVAWKDLGLELTLAMGVPSGATHVAYYPFDLPIPGDNSAIGDDRYLWNWANCNPRLVSLGDRLFTETGSLGGPTGQALQDLVNQDPGAYWDDACQCVRSQYGDDSPRLLIVTAQDPRVPLVAGGQSLLVRKLLVLFLESATVGGNVRVRLTQIHRTGSNACGTGGDFIVDCAVPTKPLTWGGIKATYR